MTSRSSAFLKGLKISAIASAVLLAACSDSDDTDSPSGMGDNGDQSMVEQAIEYSVTVTNLTAGQPLSPLAVLLHNEQYQSFKTGEAASVDLEYLAESGDNSHILEHSQSNDNVFNSASGEGILIPGASETVVVHTSEDNLGTLSLSVLSMLVNTNDAIVALNNYNIGELALNESINVSLLSYDAGTEANSETADTIPGPAASGGAREGFNAERDDVRNAVYVHPGVVTADDGLASSTLTQAHRWDHPAVQVTIQRTQ